MRSVLLSVSLCVLAGCATVSVVPGDATVETALTKSQSELRAASLAYCDLLVTKGWVEDADAFATLADTLMHGKSGEENPQGFYATRIGVTTKAPAIVLGLIASDSQSARQGLAKVVLEANAVLKAGEKNAANRGDLMSLERAVVRAQMAHRGFQEALDLVSVRSDMDVKPIVAQVDAFADTIDNARVIADKLAELYIDEPSAAGS
jgi:hypothetical protein